MDGKVDIEVTNATIHEKGHTEYDVIVTTQETLPGQLKACKVVWPVTHRFSEFESLYWALKKQYGHQMEPILLPPKQIFGTTDPEFIMKRQTALHTLMVCVIRVLPGVTTFSQPHLSSAALKEFLKWDERVQLSNLPPALKALAAGGTDGASSGSGPSSASSPGSTSATAGQAARLATASGTAASQRRLQARSAASSALAPLQGIRSPQTSTSPAAPAGGNVTSVTMPALKPAEIRISAGAAGAGVLAAPKLNAPQPAAQAPRPVVQAPRPVAAVAPLGPGARGAGESAPRPASRAPTAPAPAAPRPTGPPAAPAGVPAPDASRAGLLDSIRGGAKLKKAVTVDKAAPRL